MNLLAYGVIRFEWGVIVAVGWTIQIPPWAHMPLANAWHPWPAQHRDPAGGLSGSVVQ
jgi:hypothetical protein